MMMKQWNSYERGMEQTNPKVVITHFYLQICNYRMHLDMVKSIPLMGERIHIQRMLHQTRMHPLQYGERVVVIK